MVAVGRVVRSLADRVFEERRSDGIGAVLTVSPAQGVGGIRRSWQPATSRLRQVKRQIHAAAMLQQDIRKIVGGQSIIRLAGEYLLIDGLRQLPVSGRFVQAAEGHLERHVIGSKLDGMLKREDGLITGA